MIDLLVLFLKHREQGVRSHLHVSWVKLDSPFVEQNGEMWLGLFVLSEIGGGLSTPSY